MNQEPIINNINQQPFNIALLDNYIGTIDFTLFDISNNYIDTCLLYTSPSPRDGLLSRMPSSA